MKSTKLDLKSNTALILENKIDSTLIAFLGPCKTSGRALDYSRFRGYCLFSHDEDVKGTIKLFDFMDLVVFRGISPYLTTNTFCDV